MIINTLIRASLLITIVAANPLTIQLIEPPTPPTGGISPFENVTAPTCTTDDNVSIEKNGIIDTRYRWTKFPVQADINYSDAEHRIINDAMWNLWQVLPCINFGIWPPTANPTGDYVYIIKGTSNGCSSPIGRRGGRQELNLQSPGCMSIGTVMHEMIHALGIRHEHSRSDRDDFVNVFFQNVESGKEHNFDKLSPTQYSAFGVAYNYRSIMHYSSTSFSSNGQPTILAKNGEQVGSTGQLQSTDIQKLKNMYNC